MSDRNFQYGDRVQLTDAKGKLYSITLTAGAEWHTHKGMLKHDELVGIPEGSIVVILWKFAMILRKYLRKMFRVILVRNRLIGS